jgi:hypothetical protein
MTAKNINETPDAAKTLTAKMEQLTRRESLLVSEMIDGMLQAANDDNGNYFSFVFISAKEHGALSDISASLREIHDLCEVSDSGPVGTLSILAKGLSDLNERLHERFMSFPANRDFPKGGSE